MFETTFDQVETEDRSEEIYTAGQWHLAWRKFKQNKLALYSGGLLGVLYICTVFSGFIAPYGRDHRFEGRDFVSPQRPRFVSSDGVHIRPFVYGLKIRIEEGSGRRVYEVDDSKLHQIHFLVSGDTHSFLGFETTLHLFGAADGEGVFLFGTDRQGRARF